MDLSPSPLPRKTIPIRDASARTGYSKGYLSNLCRTGKVIGESVNGEWFVNLASLEAFVAVQAERKAERARKLAEIRAREFQAHQALVTDAPARRVESTEPEATIEAESGLVPHSVLSELIAVSTAFAVIILGALGAHAEVLPRAAHATLALAAEAAGGFEASFGNIPEQVAARIATASHAFDDAHAIVGARIASGTASVAPRAFIAPDLAFARMDVSGARTNAANISYIALDVASAQAPVVTPRDITQSASDLARFASSPASFGAALGDAYLAMGEFGYGAIQGIFGAYEASVIAAGRGSLALGIGTRDAIAGAPAFVDHTNRALVGFIADLAHGAVRADVRLAYGLAHAAPESARATVALIGGAGDFLSGAAAGIPRLASSVFLKVTAFPATAAPAIASAAFDAEYAAATRFVAATNRVSDGYLAFVDAAGRAAYAGTDVGQRVARSASSIAMIAPTAVENAYLGALGHGAVALSHPVNAFIILPPVAAAIDATVNGLSAGQRIALTTYEALRGVVGSASGALAYLFGPSPSATAPARPEVAASAPAASTTTPTRVVAVTSYPTYTTVVRGVSNDELNQSLEALRSSVLATMGAMVAPVATQTYTNITTIQQVNRIQDLADLIVRNGDFRGGTFNGGKVTSAISVEGTSGTFGSLTIGGTGSMTAGGTITAGGSITGSYFNASSAAATSTFAGSFAIDTNGFVYATSTKNVGIGVLSPSALLAIQNSNGAQPIFTASSAAGSEVYRITDAGFVGIGTTTPGYNLAVEGTSSLGNVATAGYFTATTSATSTFAGRLAVGTSSPWGNGLLTVGTSSPLLYVDSTTGYIAVGNSAPVYTLDISGNARFASFVDASHFVATSTTATSTFAGGLAVGGNQFLVDHATGYVGVGTTSPVQMLSVAGNGYFTGALGVGIATTTPGVLQTSGNAYIGGNLTVLGNSTVFGASVSDTLSINSSITSHIIPNQNATYDLGSPSYYWRNVYVGTLTANNISAASTTIGGTQSNTLTLNSDNATADTEDMSLIFYRGTVVPNALITWDSTLDRFHINQPFFIQNASATTTVITLETKALAGQTADVFRATSSAGASYFNVTGAGKVGIGTSTPAVALDIYATDALRIPVGTTVERPATGDVGYVRYNLTTHQFEGYGDNAVWQGLGGVIDANQDTKITADTNNTNEDTLRFFTFGGERMTITTTGNVGVASTSPYGLLSINPSGITGPAFVIGSSTATRFVVTNGGNVGIGTTNPASKLHVAGLGTFGDNTILTLVNANTALLLNRGRSGSSVTAGVLAVDMFSSDASLWAEDINVAYGSSANGLRVQQSGSGYAAVLTGGNVGIGTTTPWGQLSVNPNGITGPAFVIGSSTATNFLVTNAGDTVVGGLAAGGTPTSKFTVIGAAGTANGVAALTVSDNTTATFRMSFASSGVIQLSSHGLGSGQALAFGSKDASNTAFTERLRIDNTNGTIYTSNSNVGISTSTPYGLLSINPNGITGPAFVVGSSTQTSLVVTNGGKIGIGTTSPAVALDIYATDALRIPVGTTGQRPTTGDVGYVRYNLTTHQFEGYGDNAVWQGLGGVINAAQTSYITADTSDILHLVTSSVERQTITAAGNVGIATTTPWGLLSVNPNGITGPSFVVGSSTATNFIITNGGLVGIGTTSPSTTLSVAGTIYTTSGIRFPDGSVQSAAASSATAGTAGQIAYYASSGTTLSATSSLYMSPAGYVGVGSTTPTALLHVSGSASALAETIIQDNRTTSASGPALSLVKTRNSISAQNNDVAGDLNFQFYNTANTRTSAAQLEAITTEVTAAGEKGQLKFSTMNAGTLTEAMRITDTGAIGIGTSAPGFTLDVNGTGTNTFAIGDTNTTSGAAGTGGGIVFRGNDGAANRTYGFIYGLKENSTVGNDATYMAFQTRGAAGGTTEKLRIDSTGNVGIGTTSPAADLELARATNAELRITATDNVNDRVAKLSLRGSGNGGALTGGAVIDFSDSDATPSTSGALTFQKGGSTYMTILNGGNVGIGTTTPTSLLTVYGSGAVANIDISSSNGTTYDRNIRMTNSSGAQGRVLVRSGNDVYVGDVDANGGKLYLRANGATAATIDTGGNVGIGTTTPYGQLDVHASGQANMYMTSTNNSGAIVRMERYNSADGYFTIETGSGNRDTLELNAPSAAGLAIDTSGRVGLGTGSPSSKLEVNGDIKITAGSGGRFIFQDGSSMSSATGGGGVGTTSWGDLTYTTGGAINFQTGNGSATSSKMVVTNAGNVGIGTASPSSLLNVVSAAGQATLRLESGGTGQNASIDLRSAGVDRWEIGTGIANTTKFELYDRVAGATRLLVDTSGNVGIGTASPGGILNTRGTSGIYIDRTDNSTAANGHIFMRRGDASGQAAYISTYGDGSNGVASVAFNVGGNDRFAITSSGNVGIGTTSPATNLHVYGTNHTLLELDRASGTNNTGIMFAQANVGKGYVGIAGTTNGGITGSAAGDLYVRGDTQKILFSTDAGVTSNMTIATSGNIGIGTTSPATKLDVGGNASVGLAANGNSQLTIVGGQAGLSRLIFDMGTGNNRGFIDYDNALRAMEFKTNEVEAMRITSAGNVGIGTTSPVAVLDVSGGIYNTGLKISSTNTSGAGLNLTNYSAGGTEWDLISTGSANGPGAGHLGIFSAGYGNYVMTMTKTGNVGIGTTSPQNLLVLAGTGQTLRLDENSTGNTTIAFSLNSATKYFQGAVSAANGLINGSTVGDVAFRTTGGNMLFSTDNGSNSLLTLKGSNGNVGIGTTSPSEILHLDTSGRQMIRFSNGGSFKAAIGIDNNYYYTTAPSGDFVIAAANNIRFGSSGSTGEKMFINTSTGNVGIGTTTPNAVLQVGAGGGGVSQNGMFVYKSANAGYAVLKVQSDYSDGNFGRLFDVSNLTSTKFVIDGSGNVGIGTTSPMAALTVQNGSTGLYVSSAAAGASVVAGSGLATIVNGNDATYGSGLLYVKNAGNRGTSGNANGSALFRLDFSDATAMIVDKSGNVGIGLSNPGSPLQVHLGTDMNLQVINNGGLTQVRAVNDAVNTYESLSLNNSMTILAGGNVGIGTTAPGSKFEVNGDIRITSASGGRLYFADGTSMTTASAAGSGTTSWNDLNFQTGGALNFQTGNGSATSTKVSITNGGLLGIGTAAPGQLLALKGTTANLIEFQNSSGTALGYVGQAYSAGQVFSGTTLGDMVLRTEGKNIHFGTNSSSAPSVTIQATTGNVGIGTTTPGALLHVYSTGNTHQIIGSNSTNNYVYTNYTDGTNNFNIGIDGPSGGLVTGDTAGAGILSLAGNHPIQIATNGSVRMTLDGSGNVGIGTTTPGDKLEISGGMTIANNSYYSARDSGGVSRSILWLDNAAANVLHVRNNQGGVGGPIVFDSKSSGGESLRIDSSGNVGIGTSSPASYANSSAGRIVDITGTNPLLVMHNSSDALRESSIYNHTNGLYIDSTGAASGVNNGIHFRTTSTNSSNVVTVEPLTIASSGNIGVGSTTPWGLLSVNPSGITGPSFVIGSSTATNFIVTNGGKVGIGTASPAANLQVNEGTNQNIHFRTMGSVTGLAARNDANNGDVAFEMQASEFHMIGGNVGIGTTTPQGLLHVGNGGDAPTAGSAANRAYLTTNGQTDFLVRDSTSHVEGRMTASSGGIEYGAVTNNSVDFVTNNTTRMLISATGNIGIGTTNPQNKLVVHTGTDQNMEIIPGSNMGAGYSGVGIDSLNDARNTRNMLVLAGNPVVMTGGNVGIGTTTPYRKFAVEGTGNVYGAFGTTNATGAGIELFDTGSRWYIQADSSSPGAGGLAVYSKTASAYRMVIDGSGNVGIGTTAPGYKLDVNGAINATSVLINGVAVGAGGTQWASGGGGVISYTGGNVGIGTTSPSNRLTITGTSPAIQIDSTNAVAPQLTFTLSSAEKARVGVAGTTNGIINGSVAGDFAIRANNILFSTDNVAGNSAAMYISTAGNVGIGTTTPLSALDVKGALTIESGCHPGWQSNDLNLDSCSGTARIQAGSPTATMPLVINPNGGNIGIGTTNPVVPLTIAQVYTSDALPALGSATGAKFGFFDTGSPGTTPLYGLVGGTLSTGNVYLQAQRVDGTATGYNMLLQPNGGNVGIGTTSPTTKLYVANTSGNAVLGLDGSAQSFITFKQNSATKWQIGTDVTDGSGSNNLQFWSASAGGVMSMSVATGYVGIGTTTPHTYLELNGANVANRGQLTITGSDVAQITLYKDSANKTFAMYQTQSSGDMAFANNVTNGNTINILSGTGSFLVQGGSGNTVIFAGNAPASTLTTNANGYVGIGTASAYRTFEAHEGTNQNFILRPASELVTAATGVGIQAYNDAHNATVPLTLQGSTVTLSASGAADVTVNSSGNVGIGTTSPAEALVLDRSSGDIFQRFDQSGTIKGLVGIAQTAAHGSSGAVAGDMVLRGQTNVLIDTGGTTRMEILSSGNVGIGTTGPNNKLEVAKDFTYDNFTTGALRLSAASNSSRYIVAGYDSTLNAGIIQSTEQGVGQTSLLLNPNGGNVGIGTTTLKAENVLTLGPAANLPTVEGGQLALLPGTSYATSWMWDSWQGDMRMLRGDGQGNSSAVIMQIASTTGNVGIGTTAPSRELEVSGTTGISRLTSTTGTNAVYGEFKNTSGINLIGNESSTGGTLFIGSSAYAMALGTVGAYPLQFATNNNVRATIDSSGYMGLGSTTPQSKLSIVDTNNTTSQLQLSQGGSNTIATHLGNFSNSTYFFNNYYYSNGHKSDDATASSTGIRMDATGIALEYATPSATPSRIVGLTMNTLGNVGIGTSTPNFKLSVQSATTPNVAEFNNPDSGWQAEANIRFTNGDPAQGSANIGFVSRDNANTVPSNLFFRTSSSASAPTTKMVIQGGGNVGIGTTNPGTKLSFGSSVANQPLIIATYEPNAAGIGMDQNNAGLRLSGDPSGGSATDVDIGYYSGSVASHANWTSKMIVLSNGNVGIGTTAPGAELTVGVSSLPTGTISTLAGFSGKLALIQADGDSLNSKTGYWARWHSGGIAAGMTIGRVGGAWGTYIAFHNHADQTSILDQSPEVMRIDQNGNVGIGITNPGVYRTYISNTGVSGQMGLKVVAGNTASDNVIYFSGSDGVLGQTMYMSQNGNVSIGSVANCNPVKADAGGILNCSSDERLKDIQSTYTTGLLAINQISPIIYDWKSTSGLTNTSPILGFSAQNVQDVIPLAVTTDSRGYLQLDQESIIAAAVNAIKELDAGYTLNNLGSGATSTIASFYQGTTTPAITVDASGNVGIGNAAPAHTLDVAGDIAAISFVNTSTRTMKTDISYADATTTETMLAKLMNFKVATYRYTIEDQNDPLRLGFIAEDLQTTAPEVLAVDGKGVDIYKLATFTLASVQALADKVNAHETRIASLETRVAALESGAVSSGSSTISFSTSTLANALSGFGVLIQKGIAQFNTLVFRQLIASKDADGTSSAGSVTILAGNTVAQVNNSLVTPTTKVFVTFNTQVEGSWWVSDKQNGSFRVVLSAAQAADVSFDYFLVQTEGQIATPNGDGTYQGVSVSQSSGPDTVAPVITLIGENPMHIAVGATFSEPGVTVTDAVDGTDPITTYVNGIEQPADAGTIDTSSATTYIITYRAMDKAGNTTTVQRSVIVGNPDGTVTSSTTTSTTTPSGDTTAPVVTLTGSAALGLTVGDTYTDLGATATDDTDGDLTSKIVVSGTVDTATAGLYTITYSATDAAGNTGSVSRVVTVVAATSTTP